MIPSNINQKLSSAWNKVSWQGAHDAYNSLVKNVFTGSNDIHPGLGQITDNRHPDGKNETLEQPAEEQSGSKLPYKTLIATGVGMTVAVACPSLIVAGLGFGSAGIAGGSIAASLHSMSATYGFGAGLIAAGQSAGAAGLGAGTYTALTMAGGYAGFAVKNLYGKIRGPDTQPDNTMSLTSECHVQDDKK